MEWLRVPLESLCDIIIGATPSRRNSAYWGGDNVWLTISELNGETICESREHITDLGIKESPSKLIPKGTLLFSFKLSIGKIGVAGCDLYTNEAIAALPIKVSNCIERDYLKYCLQFLDVLKGSEVSVKGALLNKKKIAKIQIPLPPLSEQKRIVAILDKADEIGKKRAKADTISDRILPALFIKMFGDPVTNPMGWDVVPIKKLGPVTTGNTPSRKHQEYYGNDIEWIKSDNINTPYHILTKASEGLSSQGIKVGRTVPAGSTLVTCIAGSPSCIGNAALTDREVAFNQQINAITPKKDINCYFVYSQIVLLKKMIQSASTNAMKGMVSKGRFQEIKAILPPKDLRDTFGEKFIKYLMVFDDKSKSHALIDKLFQNLLNQAFSGELTAEWRQAHLSELLQEMEHQAKTLNIDLPESYHQLSLNL